MQTALTELNLALQYVCQCFLVTSTLNVVCKTSKVLLLLQVNLTKFGPNAKIRVQSKKRKRKKGSEY